MGNLCCCSRNIDQPSESTHLLKDPQQIIARPPTGASFGNDEQGREPTIYQAILDQTANDLIDVNRVTSGIQLGKQDYAEREVEYRQTLNQQTNSRGQRPTGRSSLPVLSTATRDSMALRQLLLSSPNFDKDMPLVNLATKSVNTALSVIAIEPVEPFVVSLAPEPLQ